MGISRGAGWQVVWGRRGLVLVGLMAIFGCPQATSGQLLESPTAAADEAPLLFTSTADALTTTPDDILAEVCSGQPAWQRPSEAEQAKHLSADPRLAAALDTEPLKTAADEFWQNDILSSTTYGLSARLEPMLLSGLWSAADQVWDACYSDDQATAINAGELAEAWLVDYQLVDVRWDGERYVMTVEAAATGLQVVHFHRVEEEVTLPLYVVDATGQEIAFISGDY